MFVRWLLALVLLGMWGVGVRAEPAPVLVRPGMDEVALAGHLAQLDDPSGQRSLDSVAQDLASWRSLPDAPNPGYTRAAIWLRLSLSLDASAVSDWVLDLHNVQLAEAQLHYQDAQGHWVVQRTGRSIAYERWPLQGRTPAFRLPLQPGVQTVYLRLSGYYSLSTDLHLWSPPAYLSHTMHEALAFGSYFGLFGVALLLQLFFWAMTQEQRSLWYLLYTLVLLGSSLLNAGYPQNILNLSPTQAALVLSLFLGVAPVAMAHVTDAWLQLRVHLPRLRRFGLLGIYGLAMGTAAGALLGQYTLAVQLNQAVGLGLVALSVGIGVWCWRHQVADAMPYVLVFGLVDAGVFVRLLRNLGGLPATFITDYALFIATGLHLLAMCFYLIYRYHRFQVSLQAERWARQEQQDFVRMVSHEFRTPLAIIDTTAQQLAAHPEATPERTQQRCQHIRNATQRLSRLLDDYLSLDRLDIPSPVFHPRPSDVYELLEEVTADWPLERIQLQLDSMPANWVWDPELMRIALRNLLANADRHAPTDRPIRLRVALQNDRGLQVDVEDDGPGIPADEQGQLFQRYFRGRGARHEPGAGLGLYIVARILKLHGGQVQLHSQPGAGCRFSLILPAPPRIPRPNSWAQWRARRRLQAPGG